MKCAIATLLVGDETSAYWRRYCRPSWSRYAARHGLELLVHRRPLDPSPRARSRSPAWQKCLVLSEESSGRFDRIAWLDADVVIHHRAPSIFDGVPGQKVGGVISGSYIQEDLRVVMMERALDDRFDDPAAAADPWSEYQRTFYLMQGLEPVSDRIVQTGVLVLSPRHHRELLETVYALDDPGENRAYEQVLLSHEILRRGLLAPLNSRFNTLFYERLLVHYPYLLDRGLAAFDELARHAVVTEYENSYFLHFAYDPTLARYLPPEALAEG